MCGLLPITALECTTNAELHVDGNIAAQTFKYGLNERG